MPMLIHLSSLPFQPAHFLFCLPYSLVFITVIAIVVRAQTYLQGPFFTSSFCFLPIITILSPPRSPFILLVIWILSMQI